MIYKNRKFYGNKFLNRMIKKVYLWVLKQWLMVTFIRDKELKPLNTFGISATAAGYVEFRNKEDLDTIFADPQWKGKPWAVISGGSNILLQKDFEGLVIHPVADGIEECGRDANSVTLRVQAGRDWDTFVAYCVKKGLGGIENLSDIPGFVGACPIQNIGAYGVEVKDTISEVEAYLVETGEVKTFSNEACRFGYRDSIFKREWKGRAVVLSVSFRLSLHPEFKLGYGDLSRETEALGGATLANVRKAVIAIRKSKLPDPKLLGNSGSFFKNPVVPSEAAEKLKEAYHDMPVYPAIGGVKLAAGWLIDRAGLKGYREGDAGVHEKQALVLVNYGNATGKEILALADRVIRTVQEKFGVSVEMEVNVL